MVYSTQQLIDILEKEMRAASQGKRVLLSSAERLDNPVIAKAIDLTKVGNVFAYQDFRKQIHAYQQEHQVSGLIWRQCTFHSETISFPELHNQLVAIDGDKEQLIQANSKIFQFWQKHTLDLKYWLVAHRPRPLRQESLQELWEQGEWAELDATREELILGICWGNPLECQYQWAKPESGCHRVIATVDRPSEIKI